MGALSLIFSHSVLNARSYDSLGPLITKGIRYSLSNFVATTLMNLLLFLK